MSRAVDRKVLTAHDPLARFDETPAGVTEPVTQPAAEAVAESDTGTARESGSKSTTLIDFERPDYQRIKRAAKARGLSVRAYVRSAALDRLAADEALRKA